MVVSIKAAVRISLSREAPIIVLFRRVTPVIEMQLMKDWAQSNRVKVPMNQDPLVQEY